jgi:hypothetical protein
MAIRVGPATTAEEILTDPTLEPKRDDPFPRSPFLVRFRLALDPHFEVLDWRSIFDEQNFTAMTGIRRQIEWAGSNAGNLPYAKSASSSLWDLMGTEGPFHRSG